jgi:ankyrin repeat protein
MGHTRIVQVLIASKADINAVDGDGLSALQFATTMGNLGVAELLKQAGGVLPTL